MFAASGALPISEPVLVTYIDLDRLIATCGLSTLQRQVVDLLMEGYGIRDIAERLATTEKACNVHLSRAVSKIARKNNANWENYVSRKYEGR